MSHRIEGAGDARVLIHKLASVLAHRRPTRFRRRAAQTLAIEILEGRVVPATITVMSLGESGPDTLRSAIMQANLDTSPDTITFDPSVTGTITLLSALPDLSTSITLDGPGPSVLRVARSGDIAPFGFRIFNVTKGAEVTISGLAISDGLANMDGGGGIANAGTLTLTNSTVSHNGASSLAPSNGGGIWNTGTLSVVNSTISGNEASSGGGIANIGTLTLTNSTISGNFASGSGGFGAFDNVAGGGGGIENTGFGSVTIRDSTLSGNSAENVGIKRSSGGGVDNSGFGTMRVINSTITGNSAANGGGISNTSFSGLTLTDSTISDNSAAFGGGIYAPGTTMTFGNTSSTASIFANPNGGNVLGTFISLGHNLFSDTPDVTLDPTDQTNVDPRLGPLADNGGPTFTQALLPGSPAVDAGVAIPGVTADQRGVSRSLDTAPDIGAFEAVGVPGAKPPTVTGVRRIGIRSQPTHLVLSFSLPLDPASATDVSNYTLARSGPRGATLRYPQAILIDSAVYDPSTQTVTLTTHKPLNLLLFYRLTINGSSPGGVAGADGVFLAGTPTGKQGVNYVTVVHRFGGTPIEPSRNIRTGPLRFRPHVAATSARTGHRVHLRASHETAASSRDTG